MVQYPQLGILLCYEPDLSNIKLSGTDLLLLLLYLVWLALSSFVICSPLLIIGIILTRRHDNPGLRQAGLVLIVAYVLIGVLANPSSIRSPSAD